MGCVVVSLCIVCASFFRVGQLLEVLMQLDCQGPSFKSGNSPAHTAPLTKPEPSCPSTNALRSVALKHVSEWL